MGRRPPPERDRDQLRVVESAEAPGDCEPQTTHPLQTVAERSAWQATATHADVMAFCRALVERSPQVTLEIVGKTYEGRELPLLILADPPLATPTEAMHSGKLVCFAFGAMHGGEVCGKEGKAKSRVSRKVG